MIKGCIKHKKIIFIILLAIIIISFNVTVRADEVIPSSEFEDENFYQYIIKNFDTNGDSLLQVSEAEAVTEISLMDVTEKITSIKGIEYFTEVQHLFLVTYDETDFNQIKSLEPIRNLDKITAFAIEDSNQITDWSLLGNLPLLNSVTFRRTNIQDLSVIEKLNIVSLELEECENIIDYTPVSKMTGLRSLWVHNSKNFSDITILKDLKELFNVHLSGTNITDISPLANLTKLQNLSLDGTAVTDISPLANLTKLSWLDLAETGITDISALASLTKLNYLKISNTCVTDLSPLINLDIDYFQVDWCSGVKDFSYIGELENLTVLHATGCNLKDIQWLEGHSNISQLCVGDNPIEILPDMTDWAELRIVSFGGTGITKEEAMAKLPAHITSREGWEEILGYNNENETNGNIMENIITENQDAGRTITSSSDNSISVQGQLESDIYLEAVKIENISDYDNLIRQINNSLTDIIDTSIYDIWLYRKEIKEGENIKIKVQPDGSIKVMIKIQEQEDVSYHVFRQEDDGTLTKLDCYIEDSTLIFYSEHFSIFTVVISRLLDDEENETDGNSHKSDNGNYIKVQQQGLNVPLLHEAESNGGGIARPTDKIQNGDNAGNENISGSGNGISTKDENRSISLENEIKEADKPAGKIKDTDNGEQDKKIDGISCIVIVSMVGAGLLGYDIIKRKRGDYMRNFQIEVSKADLDIKK